MHTLHTPHAHSQTPQILASKGYTELVVQYGRGKAVKKEEKMADGITLTAFDYKPSLLEDIAAADLVIGA